MQFESVVDSAGFLVEYLASSIAAALDLLDWNEIIICSNCKIHKCISDITQLDGTIFIMIAPFVPDVSLSLSKVWWW